jgi:hypothetical protein
MDFGWIGKVILVWESDFSLGEDSDLERISDFGKVILDPYLQITRKLRESIFGICAFFILF